MAVTLPPWPLTNTTPRRPVGRPGDLDDHVRHHVGADRQRAGEAGVLAARGDRDRRRDHAIVAPTPPDRARAPARSRCRCAAGGGGRAVRTTRRGRRRPGRRRPSRSSRRAPSGADVSDGAAGLVCEAGDVDADEVRHRAVIDAAWVDFDDERDVVRIDELSAMVSTNRVYRMVTERRVGRHREVVQLRLVLPVRRGSRPTPPDQPAPARRTVRRFHGERADGRRCPVPVLRR